MIIADSDDRRTNYNYRGYRLKVTGDGHLENDTLIYSGDEHIDTAGSFDAAKAVVDDWLKAR